MHRPRGSTASIMGGSQFADFLIRLKPGVAEKDVFGFMRPLSNFRDEETSMYALEAWQAEQCSAQQCSLCERGGGRHGVFNSEKEGPLVYLIPISRHAPSDPASPDNVELRCLCCFLESPRFECSVQGGKTTG